MAFSFSPGQIAPQGSQVTSPGVVAPGTVATPIPATPSDSPFLFIRERGGTLSVMACIQIVLVVVAILSVIICGTLYAYSIYLKAQISSKKVELEGKDATLPDYPYADMQRLSKRMATLDNLMQNYISPRSPLKFLENVVENQVVFDTFVLNKDKSGAYTVTFNVVTSNYVAMVQQLEALKLSEYKKVAPSPKLGSIAESPTLVKINVTTPVFVQGKLPDDFIFFVDKPKASQVATTTTTTSTSEGTIAGSNNPQ